MEYQPHKNLLDRCQKGDPLAQHRLFHAYVQAMYNTALRILSHSAEAEDAVQEAFIKAFSKLHTFRGEASFGSWLKRIVVNTAINKLRRNELMWVELNHESEAIIDPMSEEAGHWELDPPSATVLNNCIKELPEGCRTVLSLHLVEGYDQREVADMLGISLGTVKSQYHRAKNMLRQTLMEKKHGRV